VGRPAELEAPRATDAQQRWRIGVHTGASLAAVELPTAAPYFAVIAGIVASNASLAQEIVLLVLYNVAFVLLLLAIIMLVLFAGERADPWLQKGGAWLRRRWPVVLQASCCSSAAS
jgi:cytochrome c biogenesis protein CcdA